jgi:alkylation response protein AidB-like acyl-CoA dehydrogenase
MAMLTLDFKSSERVFMADRVQIIKGFQDVLPPASGQWARLEAAAAKYYCSETLWNILDSYVQVRGGRGGS